MHAMRECEAMLDSQQLRSLDAQDRNRGMDRNAAVIRRTERAAKNVA